MNNRSKKFGSTKQTMGVASRMDKAGILHRHAPVEDVGCHEPADPLSINQLEARGRCPINAHAFILLVLLGQIGEGVRRPGGDKPTLVLVGPRCHLLRRQPKVPKASSASSRIAAALPCPT
jgi:hypothetical protein